MTHAHPQLPLCVNFTREGLSRFGYVQNSSLSLSLHNNCVITQRLYQEEKHTFTGCVYEDGTLRLDETLRFNEGDIQPADGELLEQGRRTAIEDRRSTGVYGGIMFPILGHLMFETLSRMWINTLSEIQFGVSSTYFFHHWPGLDPNAIFNNPLYSLLLDTAGLSKDRIVVVDHDIEISKLFIPQQASIYHKRLHPVMNVLFDKVVSRVERAAFGEAASRKGRVFLSRSKWTNNSRIQNEIEVDAIFESLDFDIIFPELMRPEQLISALANAEYVAAVDGSQAHLFAFCAPGTFVIMLDTRIVPTQFALEKMRGLISIHIPLFNMNSVFEGVTKQVIGSNELKDLVSSCVSSCNQS